MKIVRLLGGLFLLHAATVHALGLGEVQGSTQIGQPLAIQIPLLGSESRSLEASCVSLLPLAADGGVERALVSSRISVVASNASTSLSITSRERLSQPVIGFQIRIGCGFQLSRDYQLLPGPPVSPTVSAESLVSLVPVVPAMPAVPVVSRTPDSTDEQLIERPTTLRLLSRQRYPGDSSARVRFIHRVAKANPELFTDVDEAFDQSLAAGTHLRLPRNLAPATSRTPPPVPPKLSLPRAASAPGKGGGRLIIGAPDSLPAPTTAELEASMDRLIDVMNEQMKVQISMAERLKRLESEIETAKRNVMLQQTINRKLEDDVRQLRDGQTQASYIQLVLAILLGGFAGAAALRWKGKQSGRDLIDDQLRDRRATATSVSKPQPKPPAKPVQLQSVFDDLLPPR
jgi:hypothetical protein